MLHAPCSTLRQRSAFTLIELLIVIAIIAILAGLAFPAVQGALESGKKTQARNDVHQLAAAIKAFQLEYGRLPSRSSGTDQLNAPNQEILTSLTSSNDLNPRGITFFEPKIARSGKGGLTNGVYKDPWGVDYAFMLDTSYDNKINTDVGSGIQQYFTTAIVYSRGGTNLSDKTKWISNVK